MHEGGQRKNSGCRGRGAEGSPETARKFLILGLARDDPGGGAGGARLPDILRTPDVGRGFRIVGEIDLSHDVARTLVSAAPRLWTPDVARHSGAAEESD